ncbi:MAG: oligoribonuclease [Myxococcales bacterium]|nr:oligoribonuclease [Myxococcales bacterium]
MADPNDHLVWLDMEMTGLDPETDVPLQIALVVTDGNLMELDAIEITIWQSDAVLLQMQPFVRRMHEENGLTKAVRKSEISTAEAEKKILAVLARWLKPGDGILAGNSIHQDRRFLQRYFPAIHGYLHYRMVDVSTLKELARRWYGTEALATKATSEHTALSDVRGSIQELTHFRKKIFVEKL